MYNEQFDKEAIAIFKALSDKTRYQIVRMMLKVDEVSCAEITDRFPLSSPALSHHFRVLENCGLMESRKEGLHMFFRLNHDRLERFLPQFEGIHGKARQESTV
ncbi:MAG: metalloregulator ArsR/SmtB family transcription factor [Chloroflexi bacterium]|nr:metalloregulator ArsR/SmtB family transcription factor [Chloroflexota bacterium]